MDYYYFLTTLEVNTSNYFFHSQQCYSTDYYKTADNYDFELKIHLPEDEGYNELSSQLKDLGVVYLNSPKILTHIPIYLKIQKEYFGRAKKLELGLMSFINNFLNLYQYFHNQYGIPTFKLDGRVLLCKSEESDLWKQLNYASINDIDFYDNIQETIIYGEGSMDLVCMLASEKEPLDFNWALLIDGIKKFYEGNFRQTFINCCTSIEVTVTEPVKEWLSNMTFSKPKELINQLIFEINNPLKFEFYINSVNPKPFKIYDTKKLEHLLIDLKILNKTRNKVAHQGYMPTILESKKAIQAASDFLKALWIYERRSFYEGMKKR